MATRTAGPFIVIEALDAGGSQTQTNLLTRRLRRERSRPLQLHFPQEDRPTGRVIYDKFLLTNNRQRFSRREQAILYIQDFFSRAADIAAHQRTRRGVVVSDRYCTSTFAYQTLGLTGTAWQAMYDWLWWLCYEANPALPTPDRIIFIDTPVAVSMARLAAKQKDFFETKRKLTAIRANYLRVAAAQQWMVVPGTDASGQERTRRDLHEEIWQHVAPLVR